MCGLLWGIPQAPSVPACPSPPLGVEERPSCPASWVLCWSLCVQGLQQGKKAGRVSLAPCPSSPVLRLNAASNVPGVELPTGRERRRSAGARRQHGLSISRRWAWGRAGLGVFALLPAVCPSAGLENLSGHQLLVTAADPGGAGSQLRRGG